MIARLSHERDAARHPALAADAPPRDGRLRQLPAATERPDELSLIEPDEPSLRDARSENLDPSAMDPSMHARAAY